MSTSLNQLKRIMRSAALMATALVLFGTAAAQAATINVTTTIDELDTGTRCSLREAIWSANNDSNAMADGCVGGSGADTINVPPGDYRLTRQPTATAPPAPPTDPHENGDLYADLDVTNPVTIANTGSLQATVFGPGNDRVFDVLAPNVTISGLSITGGSASTTDNDHGGGILNEGGLNLVSSTIYGNSAIFGGGLSTQGPSAASLTDVTISGNSAREDGGGLSVETEGNVSAVSSTVAENSADSDHNGGGNGGGVFTTTAAGGGQLALANTIVASNHDPGGEAVDCAILGGGIQSLGNALIGNTIGCPYTPAGGDITNRDAKLTGLGNYGGPTPTRGLRPKSPAVNKGKQCAANDQRGVPRKLGGRCDIGASELVFCQGIIVNRVGTAGVDRLEGTSGADGFLGLTGNDTLIGGGGKDGMCGGPGKDTLEGGAGNDRLDGGPGGDTCLGGKGHNRLRHCEHKTE